VSVDSISRLMEDAINLGTTGGSWMENKDKLPEPSQCLAIVRALASYVAQVQEPSEFIHLYQLARVTSDEGADEDWSRESKKKLMGPRSWAFVAENSPELSQVISSKEEKKAFQKKMCEIMTAGLEIDTKNWVQCHVGYILAFWIVKLYTKKRRRREDSLPTELIEGKEHFLELHGLYYDEGCVCFKQ